MAKKPRILDLRPTQFALGMQEVEFKLKKFSKFSKKERLKYCREHVIPVVHGWDGQFYLIDHHHFARACWESGVEDYEIDVLKDFSGLSEKEFWKKMIKLEWVYLRDQFGNGPHLPQALPLDIRCMADDPYRSLAWHAVEAGAIDKVTTPFFEFRWAEFLRQRLSHALHGKSNFDKAIKETMRLVQHREAQNLPGYRKPKGGK